jgi:hypothetical protein
MNSFGVLQALIFDPKKAFAELAERPKFVFPLVLLFVGTAGLVLWYYQVVDLEWMIDNQLRGGTRGGNLTDEQIGNLAKAASSRPGITAAVTVFSTAFTLVLLRVIEAVYYLLAGKITNVQRGFAHWLSLACWTSLPALLVVIPAAITLATATNAQIDQAALNPLSLNSLIFHRLPADPGYTLFANFNVLQLLGFYLAVVGVRVWSARSWLFSTVFALLPFVVVYGVWAAISLGRS